MPKNVMQARRSPSFATNSFLFINFCCCPVVRLHISDSEFLCRTSGCCVICVCSPHWVAEPDFLAKSTSKPSSGTSAERFDKLCEIEKRKKCLRICLCDRQRRAILVFDLFFVHCSIDVARKATKSIRIGWSGCCCFFRRWERLIEFVELVMCVEGT